jgi:CRP-like cAMP-binding protein
MTTNTTIAALASIELFTGLSKKELAAIDRLMTPIDIKAGKEVIKEGTAGREAFIIVEGTASVWREGKLIASVGSGAVLGEVALLANRTRTATVKAETAMTVEVLNTESLQGSRRTVASVAEMRRTLMTDDRSGTGSRGRSAGGHRRRYC